MTDAELIYSEEAPLTLGDDDGKGKPRLVVATGYGYGFRLGQVGYVTGSDVDEALASHVLVPFDASHVPEGATPGVPFGQDPGSMRPAEYVPEMGIKAQLGGSKAIDVNAFQDPDNRTVFTPAGPTSVSDDQSDKRPAERRRQSDEHRTDQALVAENAESDLSARKDQASARPHAVDRDRRENAAQADKAGKQLEQAEAEVREGMQANEADKPKARRS